MKTTMLQDAPLAYGDQEGPTSSRPSHVDVVGAGRRVSQHTRALVDEHFNFIWRSLKRLGVPEADVDDAVQEVFMVASRRLDAIDEGSERSFLFGTAIRVASNQRRRVARRKEQGDATVIDFHDPAPGPEEITELSETRLLLQQVLDELSFELKTVFVLFELEELSVPQIAELVGIPEGTIASRLRRAREAFQATARRIRARDAFRQREAMR